MCSSPVPVAFVITLLLPKPVLSGIKELLFLCSIHKCICKDNKYVVQSHSSDFFWGGLGLDASRCLPTAVGTTLRLRTDNYEWEGSCGYINELINITQKHFYIGNKNKNEKKWQILPPKINK